MNTINLSMHAACMTLMYMYSPAGVVNSLGGIVISLWILMTFWLMNFAHTTKTCASNYWLLLTTERNMFCLQIYNFHTHFKDSMFWLLFTFTCNVLYTRLHTSIANGMLYWSLHAALLQKIRLFSSPEAKGRNKERKRYPLPLNCPAVVWSCRCAV